MKVLKRMITQEVDILEVDGTEYDFYEVLDALDTLRDWPSYIPCGEFDESLDRLFLSQGAARQGNAGGIHRGKNFKEFHNLIIELGSK